MSRELKSGDVFFDGDDAAPFYFMYINDHPTEAGYVQGVQLNVNGMSIRSRYKGRVAEMIYVGSSKAMFKALFKMFCIHVGAKLLP